MWVITELGDQAILCYAEGDMQTFGSKELAQSHAVAVSLNNSGVFQVENLYAPRIQYWARLCVQKQNPLRLRAVLPR